ncbi:MAG: iron ABC transporter permease [Aquiluna sp.]|nr:iron ABC transporter permease [Aquiluna sp.]
MRKPPVLTVVLGVFAALLAIAPLGYLVLRLLEGFEAAANELSRPRTLELLSNTVLLVVSVSLTALVVGVVQAWFVVRTNLNYPGFYAVVATVPLAIPSYVLALGYSSIFPWFSGFWASWLVLSMATAPYVFLAVSASLLRVDIAAEEVGRSLGYSRLQVFLKITWPQIRTSATAAVLLVALYVLSEFGAIALLRFDTFTRAIYNAYRSSFDRTAAASLALVLVGLTLIILLLERRYRGDYLLQRPANPRRLRQELGRMQTPVTLLLALFGLLGAGLPMAALMNWTLVGSSSTDFGNLLVATLTSVGIATLAAALVSIFALAVAIWVVLHKNRFGSFIEGLLWSNHALPALVVGLALVFFGANVTPWIYQSIWLLMIAYLILFLPNGLAAMSTPLAQVPKGLTEVSQSLGESYRKTLTKVILPIASPGLIAASALVMLTVLKELPATLLLRPTGAETLATRMWSATEELAYAQAAPFALVLVIIAGLPALALNASVRKTYSEVNDA